MSDTSFRITKVEDKNAEPASKTRRQLVDSIKFIPIGETIIGVIGEVKVKSELEKEQLSAKEKVEKRELKNFLLKYITPSEINSKAKPEQNLAVLARKLDRQTLGELKRFWEGEIPSEEITDDVREQLQRTWDDISP